jgi:hypothetical protein
MCLLDTSRFVLLKAYTMTKCRFAPGPSGGSGEGSGGTNPANSNPTGQNGHGGTIQDKIIDKNLADTKPI